MDLVVSLPAVGNGRACDSCSPRQVSIMFFSESCIGA
jgi:hypothetical protein